MWISDFFFTQVCSLWWQNTERNIQCVQIKFLQILIITASKCGHIRYRTCLHMWKATPEVRFLFIVYYFIFTPYFCLLQQKWKCQQTGGRHGVCVACFIESKPDLKSQRHFRAKYRRIVKIISEILYCSSCIMFTFLRYTTSLTYL